MTSTLLPNAKQTFTGPNGTPLSGGSVHFYIPGTTTPKDTYQDAAQTILNTNPVILDANGQAVIWGGGSYRQMVYDVNGNLIWDQVTEDSSGGLIGNITDNIYSAAGGDFVPGTTTTLTLSSAPGAISNLWAFFDGVFQTDDQMALAGTSLTFSSPIPVGVEEVTVKVGNSVAIGIPGSGTVIDVTVAPNARIQSSKLAYQVPGLPAGSIVRTVQARLGDFVSVMDFGAKGDGVTNDGPACLAAHQASPFVFYPFTAAGYNLGTTQIPIGSGAAALGENQVVLKSTAGAASSVFLCSGYEVQSEVSGFTFDMTGADSTSCAIYLKTSAAPVSRVVLDNLLFRNCYGAIQQDAATNYAFEIYMSRIKCQVPYGPQILFPFTQGFIFLRQCNIDCTLSATPLVTWTSIEFDKMAGLFLEDVDVTGQAAITTQAYQAGAVGIRITGAATPPSNAFVWLRRVRCESSMGPGIEVVSVNFLRGETVEAFACMGLAVYFESIDILELNTVYGRGANDQQGGAAGSHGVSFVGCQQGMGVNIAGDFNTGSGIFVNNSTGINLGPIRANGNSQYGLLEAGTSNGNTYASKNFSNNTSGAYSLVGATSNVISPELMVYLAANNTFSGSNVFEGGTQFNGIVNLSKSVNIAASTTAGAPVNYSAGAAPSSPNNGDFWFDGANFKAQVGGVTKTFTIA